jgi:hypothetical protein
MQPETRTEQRNAVGAAVRHSLSEKDREAVAAMRKEVAPFKGKMSDPSARPPFDEVMEHTPDARGVTYEKAGVGGVPGISCTPQGTRRLAPEHRFPAALDDSRAAYRGLVEGGARKIAIVGDSAGGGLALALLSIVQSEGVAPVAAVVMSPWTDLSHGDLPRRKVRHAA